MFNLCFPFIPSLFYIVLNDDYMLCKVSLGVLKGASKLNVLLLLLSLVRLFRTENPVARTTWRFHFSTVFEWNNLAGVHIYRVSLIELV